MLEIRDNSYFNSIDAFLIYNGVYTLVYAEEINGYWYCKTGLKYKLSTIPAINCNEFIGNEVILDEFKGKITKVLVRPNNFVEGQIGINWHQGQKNIPHYWHKITKKICESQNLVVSLQSK